MDKKVNTPITEETIENLTAGDYVYISGTIYTARDAAHKRMYEALERGEDLPFSVRGQIIYYMGPSPAREGRPIIKIRVRYSGKDLAIITALKTLYTISYA